MRRWATAQNRRSDDKVEDDMADIDLWAEAVRQAQEELGYQDPGIPRTVDGIRGVLRHDLRDAFDADLGAMSQGSTFEVFLDEWWTQTVVDAAGDDEDTREAALEFADLAVALRISGSGGPTFSTAEVEDMLGFPLSAGAQ
jgi:hypothetical protein